MGTSVSHQTAVDRVYGEHTLRSRSILRDGFQIFWCRTGENQSCQCRSWIGVMSPPTSRGSNDTASQESSMMTTNDMLWCVAGCDSREEAIRALEAAGTERKICVSTSGKKLYNAEFRDESDAASYVKWVNDDGARCDVAVVGLEDIGAVVLGASAFFVRYKSHANQYTSNEYQFCSFYPILSGLKPTCCWSLCSGEPYCTTGGLHISFVDGQEALTSFATALQDIMLSRGLKFPRRQAEYVTVRL